MSTILVTGAAGFIGSCVCETLLTEGYQVIGLDNFNEYYDVKLKRDRVRKFHDRCPVYECDIADYSSLKKITEKHSLNQICHLAAQAGVRYSVTHPFLYEKSNVLGTLNLLELCREKSIKSFVFASSSSIYGNNKKIPFSVTDPVDHPVSLYAATKRSNELMAYTYHHLFGIQCTALRLFTVYGPWGRPDMALFKFSKAILEDQPIDVYNFGKMKRDFTFVTDIADGIVSALEKNYPFEIFNLGNSRSVELLYFIECIEKELGKKAKRNLLPMQAGDIPESYADIEKSRQMLQFEPKVGIETGVKEFLKWYRAYYKV